jgi:hypothetical protein
LDLSYELTENFGQMRDGTKRAEHSQASPAAPIRSLEDFALRLLALIPQAELRLANIIAFRQNTINSKIKSRPKLQCVLDEP